MNKNKIFIGLGIVAVIVVIVLTNAVDRVSKYGLLTPYEQLTFTEKIAAKISGIDFKTSAEWEASNKEARERMREDDRAEIIENAKEEGAKEAEMLLERIEKGDFTHEQYLDLYTLLMEKLSKNEITIDELNQINRSIAYGEAKIEDYLKKFK